METIWDKIYQDYAKGKVHPALESDDILGDFRSFVETSAFSVKSALEIGCGRGRYLQYLEGLGFTVSGIDSSSTAISLSKTIMSTKAKLDVEDMFRYDIPKNQFDLVFSIATIHHGKKEEVNNLIHRMISGCRENGKIFITLPIYPEKGLSQSLYKKIINQIMRFVSEGLPNIGGFKTLKRDLCNRNWDAWKYMGNGVTLPLSGREKGLFHSYYKREELDKVFSGCLEYTIERNSESWIIKATTRGQARPNSGLN